METSLYVALSGQVATERRLATIADNIANMNTAGFRQGGVRFSELIDSRQKERLSFVSTGISTLSERQGALNSTGNQLDFSINGQGWFMVQTPAGDALTRDGRFQVAPDGTLTNLDGYPVLDQGGAPIQLNLALGPLVADQSGIMHQRGTIVGSIGVYDADPAKETMRNGSLSFVPEGAVTPSSDAGSYTLQQGFVENSNIDAVEQIAKLISVQRNFEQSSSLMQKSENSLEEAIRMLGGK